MSATPIDAAPNRDFFAELQAIEEDIEFLHPKQVYLRDTWYPIRRRLILLDQIAPTQEIMSMLVSASFIIYRIQDTRGPKHKEKIRQELLESVRRIRRRASAVANNT